MLFVWLSGGSSISRRSDVAAPDRMYWVDIRINVICKTFHCTIKSNDFHMFNWIGLIESYIRVKPSNQI